MATSSTGITPRSTEDYHEVLANLSDGSVRRHFDPYLDIAWDAPEMAIDPGDPRWILSPEDDTLGATEWYRNLPQDKQIELGRWRVVNAIKVGAAFESILIRGMMQYIMKLPNNKPEFRYSLHEMTEECNHIQMFQELVNRSGTDVPGMRPLFKRLSPWIGIAGGYAHVILFIGILGGEEPIDHYQKALLRRGNNLPPAVLRTMEIHIAEEARHISFAGEFLQRRFARMSPRGRRICAYAFPIVMRWLATEIMRPHPKIVERFAIPDEVMREAFWDSPQARKVLAGYFGDMRALADSAGLYTPGSRRVWRALRVDGPISRYRSEPDRTPTPTAG